MNHEAEKLKIHFAYCALILVLVIIAVATDRWTAQQKFTEYLSNAATMTSLVLGLVAIFYSFIANDGLSRSLGNINTASDTITQTRDQISSYVDLTAATSEATKRSADQMQSLSVSVGRDLSALGETLSQIRDQSLALHGAINALPVRIDKLETSVLDATRTVGEKLAASQPAATAARPVDASIVKRFLELAPMTGNLLAVACAHAARTGKNLVLADFTSAVGERIDAYMSGFLAAMNAGQIVSRDFVPNQNRTYTLKSVHPALNEMARSYFIDYLERTFKNEPETKASWLEKLSKVDALFS